MIEASALLPASCSSYESSHLFVLEELVADYTYKEKMRDVTDPGQGKGQIWDSGGKLTTKAQKTRNDCGGPEPRKERVKKQ
jgi:hypothetical protein